MKTHVLRVPALGGAVVALGLALSACSSGDTLEVGEVASATGTVEGRTVEVVLPSGTLELVLGEAAQEVDGMTAPDGGSLLPVSTDFAQGEVRDDVWRFSGRADTLQPAEVTISVGDSDYGVGSVRATEPGTDGLPRQFVLALAEPADEVQAAVEVAYDGLTQRVAADGERESGPADPLYEDPAPLAPATCGDVSSTPALDPGAIECRLDRADLVPYLPGPGWAAEGRSWLAVSVAVGLDPVDVDGGDYVLGSVQDDSRLDGQPAVAVLDAAEPVVASGWSGTLVFDVPADLGAGADLGELDLALLLGLEPADGQLGAAVDPVRLRAGLPLADGSSG